MTSGKLCPVSTCMTGKGSREGQKAFWASRSMTIESFPPEKSRTGRSNSATTSRMMWMDCASRACRCDNWYCPGPADTPCSMVFHSSREPLGNLFRWVN